MAPSRPAVVAAHTDRDPWLPGFAWALPAAFAGAVSTCRFEQGDVLHATRDGYGEWRKGAPGVWLQVLDPPRSARAATGGADASRFVSQWTSPVELDLDDANGGALRRISTTQGRLFTCLWRGGLEALEAGEAPPPPLLLADLQRGLEPTLAALRAALSRSKRRTKADAAAMLFVSGLDRASDASLAKADTIATALASRFAITVHDAAPADAGVAEADQHHPALAVRGIRVEAADEAGVTEALKAVLYSPGARARSAGSEAPDGEPATSGRFSLARHGLLVPFVAEQD